MLIQRATLLDGGTADIRVEERIVEVAARLSRIPASRSTTLQVAPSSPVCTIIMSTSAPRRPH